MLSLTEPIFATFWWHIIYHYIPFLRRYGWYADNYKESLLLLAITKYLYFATLVNYEPFCYHGNANQIYDNQYIVYFITLVITRVLFIYHYGIT